MQFCIDLPHLHILANAEFAPSASHLSVSHSNAFSTIISSCISCKTKLNECFCRSDRVYVYTVSHIYVSRF